MVILVVLVVLGVVLVVLDLSWRSWTFTEASEVWVRVDWQPLTDELLGNQSLHLPMLFGLLSTRGPDPLRPTENLQEEKQKTFSNHF